MCSWYMEKEIYMTLWFDHGGKSLEGLVFILKGGAIVWKSLKQENSKVEFECIYIATLDVAKGDCLDQKFIYELGVVPSMLKWIPLFV